MVHRLSCPSGRSCVGSSRIRDRTGVPCTGRQILNHWTTRKLHPDNIYKVLITDQNYAKPFTWIISFKLQLLMKSLMDVLMLHHAHSQLLLRTRYIINITSMLRFLQYLEATCEHLSPCVPWVCGPRSSSMGTSTMREVAMFSGSERKVQFIPSHPRASAWECIQILMSATKCYIFNSFMWWFLLT